MSDRKSEIIKELESHIKEVEGLHYTKIAAVNDLVNSAYRAKRELDSPRIIRTVEELEALEPNDLLVPTASEGFEYEAVRADSLLYVVSRWGRKDRLPAVVVATGAQVRAARKALEQEHG